MKAYCSIIFFTLILTGMLFAQNTSVQLPTAADTSSSFRITNFSGSTLLRLNADGGFYFSGAMMTGSIPVTGTGTRLMWFPGRSAFRVGTVNGALWDEMYIGLSSIAMGRNTSAQGESSTAVGTESIANADYSTAIGSTSIADGYSSMALGSGTYAQGDYSTAMGTSTVASGSFSTAIGYSDTASGARSIALGCYVSTNGKTGSCIIGDGSSSASLTRSSTQNEMTMRFDGGYRLYTNYTLFSGVLLPGGASSWASVSDSTKKTNYKQADGEYFLRSISQLRLGSWNYKGQDEKNFRHYGPMAQEIFHYFGKDAHGTIGDDTTLATADMDGIMMICLQALEKRTADLQKANEKIAEHETKIEILEKKIEALSAMISSSTTNFNPNITNNK